MSALGVVAAGHEATAQAAEAILREGGNAFDAIVAAHAAACVAEPVLSSLGGGGFLLAQPAGRAPLVYDFFVQTPRSKRDPEDTEFFPIEADFGPTTQEFHIGAGSVATPGTVKGLFAIHGDLCTMPMGRLLEPAIRLGREGVTVNRFQGYLCRVVQPILLATRGARAVFASPSAEGGVIREGELLRQPLLAETLEALGREGEQLFYAGEVAASIDRFSRDNGGHLRRDDLASYELVKRPPLEIAYRGARILTNPPPSSGGILVGFALKILEGFDLAGCSPGTGEFLDLLAGVMELTNRARIETHLDGANHPDGEKLYDPVFLHRYARSIRDRPHCARGTTHMSVMDRWGSLGSLTVSNGEGCGRVLTDSGIMLNNMLGEEDINPQGFHQWPTGCRMTSMMSPSALFLPDDRCVALGSGGSNRIRTAIFQVLVNLVDFRMKLSEAVTFPRIHWENGRLSVEGGFPRSHVEPLMRRYPHHKVWEDLNLFFGGVHSVIRDGCGFAGAGDPRRDGHAIVVER